MTKQAMRGSEEYRRTCKRCGAQWYVSADQVKREKLRLSKSDQRATKMIDTGALLSGDSGVTAFTLRHTQERAQAEATSHCSACGSGTYTEEALIPSGGD